MKNAIEEPIMVVATVSVQDLREQTEPILRRVSEEGETIEVVDGDKPLALLVPAAPAERRPMTPEEQETFWAEWDKLAAEIGAYWPEGVSAVEAVREQRRDLSDRQPVDPKELAAWIAELDELAAEIGAHWPEGVSVDDAIRDIRREL